MFSGFDKETGSGSEENDVIPKWMPIRTPKRLNLLFSIAGTTRPVTLV
jgi:hypothetical protein